MNLLVQHVHEAKIHTKVKRLKNDMERYINTKQGDKEELIRQSKTLFEKMTQVMKSSEKKLGKSIQPWFSLL